MTHILSYVLFTRFMMSGRAWGNNIYSVMHRRNYKIQEINWIRQCKADNGKVTINKMLGRHNAIKLAGKASEIRE